VKEQKVRLRPHKLLNCMKVSDVVYIFEKFMIFKQENEFENPHSKHLHKLMGLSKVVQKERFKKIQDFFENHII
jgi:hypothetical protein|tara:strand:- start:579 stop:800 length:222 start_codon:yes stop_codon:yes gene_type:complete